MLKFVGWIEVVLHNNMMVAPNETLKKINNELMTSWKKFWR